MENNMELPQLTLAQQEDLLKGTKYDGAFNTTKVRPSPADNSAGTTEAEGADCLGQDGGRTERHKPGAGTPGENN